MKVIDGCGGSDRGRFLVPDGTKNRPQSSGQGTVPCPDGRETVPVSLGEQVLTELAAIGLTRATDVLTILDDGLQIKREELKPGAAAAIASVEKTSGGWKIKFYDKLKALELLGDHLGLFGGAGRVQEESNLLEAILSSTGEAMDTSDIQELQ